MSLNDAFDFAAAAKNITVRNAFDFAHHAVLIGQSEWYRPGDVIEYCEWAKGHQNDDDQEMTELD